MSENKLAVIYARFSSSSQREESIEGQLKACYDYAKREGYSVVGEYIDRALSVPTRNIVRTFRNDW
ncbi:MAG: recombinase family protein [Collinsella sp.]